MSPILEQKHKIIIINYIKMNIASYGSTTRLMQAYKPDLSQFRARMFKETDADGSGGISKAELGKMFEKNPNSNEMSLDDAFAKADSDGNGEISQDENDAAMQEVDKRMEMRGGSPMGKPERPQGLLGADSGNMLLNLLPKNNDSASFGSFQRVQGGSGFFQAYA